jgi:hypothetical protein
MLWPFSFFFLIVAMAAPILLGRAVKYAVINIAAAVANQAASWAGMGH